ncbi:MAG: PspC domain-containing protein [Candidatus Woesearchaeota archaeon]
MLVLFGAGIFFILFLIVLIFFFWTWFHCLLSGLNVKEKLVWTIAFFAFPIITNFLYLIFINKGDKMKKNRIVLGKEKIFGGVCSGLANHFKIDPFYVRVITVLLLFVSFGTVLIAYLILWIIMQQPTSEKPSNSVKKRSKKTRKK